METQAEVAGLVWEGPSARSRRGVEKGATGQHRAQQCRVARGSSWQGHVQWAARTDTEQDQTLRMRFTSSGSHWWVVNWAVKKMVKLCFWAFALVSQGLEAGRPGPWSSR